MLRIILEMTANGGNKKRKGLSTEYLSHDTDL